MTHTNDQKAAAAMLLRIRKASLSFPGFMDYYYPELEWPGYAREFQDVLDNLEKDTLVSAGGNPVRQVIVSMPPRHSKLLADDTPVLTPSGWRAHGDLSVGDFVFGSDGSPTEIVATSMKGAANVRVTLSNGESVLCNDDHLWTVYDRARGDWRTVDTRHIRSRALVSGGRAVLQLPDTPATQAPDASLPMSPYTLGAWLGDGTGSKPAITHHETDREVVAAIAEEFPVGPSYRHTVGDKRTFTTYFSGFCGSGNQSPMTAALIAAGVWKNKHIPREYMGGSVEQRLQLLAGLIDADGSVDKKGRVRIVTVVERLRDDYFELATSLGLRPYIMTQDPAGKGRRTVYCVGFQPNIAIPTRLPRKKISGGFAKRRRVGIVSAEFVGGGAIGHCITVANKDGLYLAGRSLYVTHNSFTGTINFAAYSMMRKPTREVMIGSYNNEMATTFGRQTREIVTSPAVRRAFPNVALSKETRAVDFWKTSAGGAYYSIGMNGTSTGRGANCLTADAEIVTFSGTRTIQSIVDEKKPVSVLAFDHDKNEPAWRTAYAFASREAGEIFAIRDSAGGVVEATGEHPFYVVGRGYVEARDLAPGDVLLRLVRDGDDPLGGGHQEISQARARGYVLLAEVLDGAPRGQEHSPVQDVREAGEAEWRAPLLLDGVQGGGEVWAGRRTRSDEDASLRPVPIGVRGWSLGEPLLLDCVQEHGALGADDWHGEPDVRARALQPQATASHNQGIHASAPEHQAKGRDGLRRLQEGAGEGGITRPPHRPQPDELPVGQPRVAVRELPPSTPQVGARVREVTVSVVERVCKECLVYNFTVEGTNNYFANGILTHNCLVIDDPYKTREEAESMTVRRKVWDEYIATFRTRLQPSMDGQPAFVIVTHTRWHPDDLIGRIMETPEFKAGEWLHLNFQALSVKERGVYIRRTNLDASDPAYIPPRIETTDGETLRLGDIAGSRVVSAAEEVALWPERFPVEWLRKQRSVIGEREFSALYQQSPYVVGGNLIKQKWFRRFRAGEQPQFSAIAFGVDTAFKAKARNDYTVFSLGGVTEIGDIYLLKVWREKLEFPDLKRKAVLLNSLYRGQGLRGFWIEDAASGQSLIQELKNDTSVVALPWRGGTTDKVAKANLVTPLMEGGRVFIPEEADWLDDWLDEVASFPNGKHDDQVDSLVIMLDALSRLVVVGNPDWAKPIGEYVASPQFSGESAFTGRPLVADEKGWQGKGGFEQALGLEPTWGGLC